jgi:hypothetical protein
VTFAAGTTVSSLTTSGAVSAGSLTVNSNNISAVNSLGFRNRIINGGMVIDQRNAGASVTVTGGSSYYSCDRWQEWMSQNSKYSIQRSTTAPTGFINSLLATSLSAYSVISSDSFALNQIIEGLNCADLAWGTASASTVTVSFWVRSSLTGTFGGALSNSAVNRSYPFTYTISSANTFEYKTITIPGDTSGTWLTDNGIGIRLWFSIGAGSTYLGTAGSWAGADYRGATGQTSVVGTNGATFYITGVQLEAGSVATPFERRDYGRELIMCQRYYQVVAKGAFDPVGVGCYTTASRLDTFLNFKVSMRAAPSLSVTTGTNYYTFYRAGADDYFNSLSLEQDGTEGLLVKNTTDVSGTAGVAGIVVTVDANALIAATAEL